MPERNRAELVEEWRSRLTMVYIVADALRSIELPRMQEALDRAEAVTPLFDPSAWIQYGDIMREDAAVVRILAHAKRELDALPWPEKSGVREAIRNGNATAPEVDSGARLETQG